MAQDDRNGALDGHAQSYNPIRRLDRKGLIQSRVLEIGRRIFELCHCAQPAIWHKAWWLERATQLVDSDPRLRTRAYQFVDCLPSLQTNANIARHLREYLAPRFVELPRGIFGLIGGTSRSDRPLANRSMLQQFRDELIGRSARFGATMMAGRFITGFDVPSVIKTLRRLRLDKMAFTLDVLGEFTTSNAQADRYANSYHQLIERLSPIVRSWTTVPLLDHDERGAGVAGTYPDSPGKAGFKGAVPPTMPRLNLSVKLTSLDPHFDSIDPARSIASVCARLRPLLLHARQAGAFINIDMESSKYHDLTLELFKQLLMERELRDWSDVGIVLQAYLTRGEMALADLLEWAQKRGARFAVRLVKGAYWDAETAAAVRNNHEPPVWQQKWQSDACYERMARTMLENEHLIRPAFASHNVRSLAFVCAVAEELGLSPNSYEVQMLHGMGDPLKHAMVRMGRCVRVYCPYGDLMPGMGYLIRRLLENSSNEGFLKQGFSDRGAYDRLLADPQLNGRATHSQGTPKPTGPRRSYRNRPSRVQGEDPPTYPEECMIAFRNATNTSFSSEENRRKMLAAIESVRGEFGRRRPIVIDGQAITTDHWFASHNPSNSAETLGHMAMATSVEADQAIAAAHRAFQKWKKTRAAERASLLRKLADRLEMRRFELAAVMIVEVGKPWREADADVSEAIDHCRYYAEQIEWIASHPRLRNLPGEDNSLSYRPKGVCTVISPWAFPLAILTGMTTAPLAAGDTVVIKPARQASVVAAKLVEMIHDVGFPPGVVNFLPGPGETIGQHLVEHGDVSIVAFTGSAEAGTQVLQAGSRTRPGQNFIKKMIVEMGGKNAIIVDDDADLDAATAAIMESAFAFAGQKCSSCSRVIALDAIHDALCERLKEAVESAIIGPADAASTTIGPVIDAAARDRINEYIEIGKRECRQGPPQAGEHRPIKPNIAGGQSQPKPGFTGGHGSFKSSFVGGLLVQPKLPPECDDGYFVAPIIFTGVSPDARIAQEEIFGPVLAVLRAATFEEAIDIANGTPYALTGGVFSRSPANIELARRAFAVGNLYINRRITGSQVDAQPFGGFKLSGTGVKAGSPDYLLHFMDAQCITENTLRSGLVPENSE